MDADKNSQILIPKNDSNIQQLWKSEIPAY